MAKRERLKSYEDLTRELNEASDRAVGILGGAYVEDALLDSLLFWLGLDQISEKHLEEILGNNAPLSTFSNKIMLAEKLSLIGPRTRRDLDTIRKIRNRCAHAINPTPFSDSPVVDLVANLTPRRLPNIAGGPYLPPPSEPRKRFLECCHQLYDQFYNDDRSYVKQAAFDIPFGFELD